jgi:hypothetical protein
MPTGLRLLDGTGRGSETKPDESFRLRPGERPVWVELAVTEGDEPAWRRRAAALGLSVDVCVALQAEWSLVAGELAELGLLEPVLERAREQAGADALAPTEELRRWLRFLSRGPAADAESDLPSLAMPARVVARMAPMTLADELRAHGEHGLNEHALVLERAATLAGMTMEAWAYRHGAQIASPHSGS